MFPSNNLNKNVAALLEREDITDPTDFPSQSVAPGLRQIDSAVRCKICKEIISAPVTLQCGHCFCSICIRSTLADKQECPSCRKTANEGHLRANPLVEEIVTSWMEARAFVLRLSKDEERCVTKSNSIETVRWPRKSKKRKMSMDRDSSPSSVLETPSKAGPSRTKQARLAKRSTTPKAGKFSLDEDDLDVVATSDSREEELSSVADENVVDCPICQKQVRFETINSHIDANCLFSFASDTESPHDRRSKKSEWSTIFSGATYAEKRKGKERRPASPIGPDPVPKAAYNVLKEKQIKDLLAEHRLPMTGDRKTLIARHQRWVMIYNGNLDRSVKQRRTVEDLRQELTKWERERKGKRNTVNDIAAYRKANKAEFAHLIEAARPKKVPKGDGDGKNAIDSNSAVDDDEVMVVVDSEEERR